MEIKVIIDGVEVFSKEIEDTSNNSVLKAIKKLSLKADDLSAAFALNSANIHAKLDNINRSAKTVIMDDDKLEPLIQKVVSYTIEVKDNLPIYVDADNKKL